MYKVGAILKEKITHKDAVAIAIQEGLITITICYKKDYTAELVSFKSDKLDMRIKKYGSVINFAYCFGKEWYLDSCYNPHLSPYLDVRKFREEKLGLLIVFIDADTGRVESIRFQGLADKFRDKLLDMIDEEQSKKSVILERYHAEVADLYIRYSSKALFKNAYENRCLIEDWQMPMVVMFSEE